MSRSHLLALSVTVIAAIAVSALPAAAKVVRGNNGKNTLYGTELNDYIDGKGGPDRIYGRGGNDDLYGRNGDDRIEGGFGNDRIWTAAGADDVYAGPGDDIVTDDYGHDEHHGGAGNDQLYGGSAPDDLYGEDGDDHLGGGTGSDQLYGGDGNDTIFGQQGKDTIDAGAGNDTVYANDNGWDKEINCGDGADLLYVDQGGTSAGDHDLKYVGDRYLDCELVIEVPTPSDPLAGISWDAPDDYSPSFGQGTPLNDRLLGHHGSDRLVGDAGDDVIWADSLPRGDGNAIRTQSDIVNAGPGNDTVYGSPGANNILGGDGNDILQGGVGSGLIDAGPGDDQIKLRTGGEYRVAAGDGNDRIVAIITLGSAIVNCGSGHDVVELPQSLAARRLVTLRRDCERKKIDGSSRTTAVRHEAKKKPKRKR